LAALRRPLVGRRYICPGFFKTPRGVFDQCNPVLALLRKDVFPDSGDGFRSHLKLHSETVKNPTDKFWKSKNHLSN